MRHSEFEPVPCVIGGAVVLVIAGGIGVWAYTEHNEPDAGTITDMEHEPEHWDSGIECLPKSGGGVECLPYNDYYPATWCIWYEDAEGAEGDDCVSEARYESFEIGDTYTKD